MAFRYAVPAAQDGGWLFFFMPKEIGRQQRERERRKERKKVNLQPTPCVARAPRGAEQVVTGGLLDGQIVKMTLL